MLRGAFLCAIVDMMMMPLTRARYFRHVRFQPRRAISACLIITDDDIDMLMRCSPSLMPYFRDISSLHFSPMLPRDDISLLHALMPRSREARRVAFIIFTPFRMLTPFLQRLLCGLLPLFSCCCFFAICFASVPLTALIRCSMIFSYVRYIFYTLPLPCCVCRAMLMLIFLRDSAMLMI